MAYGGEGGVVDRQVGRLLDGVKATRGWEHTAVVLVADHGESLTEHQHHSSHQHSLYEPVLRVPLVVREPGGCAGCVRLDQVSTVRVATTLRVLAGLERSTELVGPSLLEVDSEIAIAVGPVGWSGATDEPRRGLQAAARANGHKVVALEHAHAERYPLDTDPREQGPLLDPDDQASMRAHIAGRLDPESRPVRLFPLGGRQMEEGERQALLQDGLLGGPVGELSAEFDALEEAAREALGQLNEVDEAQSLPEDVRAALEVLGYLQ